MKKYSISSNFLRQLALTVLFTFCIVMFYNAEDDYANVTAVYSVGFCNHCFLFSLTCWLPDEIKWTWSCISNRYEESCIFKLMLWVTGSFFTFRAPPELTRQVVRATQVSHNHLTSHESVSRQIEPTKESFYID